ncbi:MAG: DUF86 domain-containing protein [Acidobacteria bacterium]|nr:DUF86 domain-containing protein [Acidobacteriota bacterium]
MSALDLDILAEKTQAVQRHLRRVADRLPADASALLPLSDASDAVILHLWQATQIVIDLALGACIHFNLGTPSGYGDAFRRLEAAGFLDSASSDRLVKASGFRNTIAHAYETLDMKRVYAAATDGPRDLTTFLGMLRDRVGEDPAGIDGKTEAGRGAPRRRVRPSGPASRRSSVRPVVLLRRLLRSLVEVVKSYVSQEKERGIVKRLRRHQAITGTAVP